MSLSPAQIEARKTGIGGSDIAAVCGLSPYKTAVDVWLEKTGRSDGTAVGEPAYWGNALEDIIAKEYSRRNNLEIRRINQTLRHPQHDFALANVDRNVIVAGHTQIKHLLEVKTASPNLKLQWFEEGESVPIIYQAQCQWYLGITGADVCDVAVLIGGNEYAQRRVERDDDTISILIEAGRKFWVDHVLTDLAPPVVNASDALKLWPRDNGSSIEADAEMVERLSVLQEAKQRFVEAETKLEEATTAVKALMSEASAVTIANEPVVTWKQNKSSNKTDWKSAFEALVCLHGITPDHVNQAIADNTRTVLGARPFSLKIKGSINDKQYTQRQTDLSS